MEKPITSTGIESRQEIVALQAERASAAQAERERIARITSLGTKWRKPAAFISEHIDRGTSAEDFGRLILDQAAEDDQRVQTQGASMNATNLQAFRSFGEMLQAVASASGERGRLDPRLRVELASGLNEGIGSEGGFLVQTDFSTQLLEAAMAAAIVVPRCTRIPISNPSNAVKLPAVNETSRADGSRWGGVQMYWKGEAEEKTATKPGFRIVELALKKLIGLCYATDELLQDASALEAYVRAAFAAEAAFKLDDGIIRGLGAGMPLGILNSPCLVTVAKETGQAAATIKAENIVKMFSRMYAGGVANSVWLVNQDVFPQLYLLGQTVGTGGAPVYMPPGGLSGSPYSTLFGRPVFAIEQCSTLGTVGDIIFGDFTQYLVAEKGGMDTASSVHVRFVYDETAFRFIYRFDGSPAWASALTPYQGTNTTSPFIVLATRAN